MICRWTLRLILSVTVFPALAADEPAWPPRYTVNGQLVVTPVDKGNTFAVYSTEAGRWTSFTFPDGVRATPITSACLVAFQLEGRQIKELVAVDRRGIWRTHHLPRAVDGACTPIIGNRIAWYEIDGEAHAFSAQTGEWDSIASKSGQLTIFRNNTATDSEFLLLDRKSSLAAFTVNFPTWASVETAPAAATRTAAD